MCFFINCFCFLVSLFKRQHPLINNINDRLRHDHQPESKLTFWASTNCFLLQVFSIVRCFCYSVHPPRACNVHRDNNQRQQKIKQDQKYHVLKVFLRWFFPLNQRGVGLDHKAHSERGVEGGGGYQAVHI